MFEKILIATDGAEYTKSAVEHGLELARVFRSKVYAIYVVSTPSLVSTLDVPLESVHGLLQKEGEYAVKTVTEIGFRKGLNVERVVVEGYPAEEIVKFANKQGVGMIVMGTAGKRGMDKFLLGSVAEKVIRTSAIPVLVVRGKR